MLTFEQVETAIKEGSDLERLQEERGHQKNNRIRLSPFYQELAPHQRIEVSVFLDSIKPESLEEFFEVQVRHSTSLFFTALAEIQAPRVALNRTMIDLGKIYAGVTEVVDEGHKQCIVLKNYGNIPASF